MHMDEKIAKALHEAGENIEADEWLMRRIKADIAQRKSQGERTIMKRKHMKWVAVGAMLLMTSTAAYAISTQTHTGHSYHDQDLTTPPSVSELNEKVGYAPQYIEAFSNGWTFESASIVNNETDDQDSAADQTWKSIDFNYKNAAAGKTWVVLSTTNVPSTTPYPGEKVQLTTQEGNISAVYFEQKFKFVPPSYELSEEDKAAEANGSLVISYGSDKVKEEVMYNVCWESAGIAYQLLTNSPTLDRDALLAMAEEIVAQ